MAEPTTEHPTFAAINARLDLLSAQILQLAAMNGQAGERAQTNQRELITYVTSKVEELTTAYTDLATSVAHLHATAASAAMQPDAPDETETPGVRLPTRGRHGRD